MADEELTVGSDQSSSDGIQGSPGVASETSGVSADLLDDGNMEVVQSDDHASVTVMYKGLSPNEEVIVEAMLPESVESFSHKPNGDALTITFGTPGKGDAMVRVFANQPKEDGSPGRKQLASKQFVV